MGEKSKYRSCDRGIGHKLFAIAITLGVTAGTISWWLGFVWFYRIWPKSQFASFTELLSQAVDLSNPDAEQGFFEAYSSLLRKTTRIAWYRIIQSTLALIPLVVGLWIAWVIDHSWTYILTTTITTLALGIRSLVHRSRKTDHHAIDSQ
jgi:hypothetical protein